MLIDVPTDKFREIFDNAYAVVIKGYVYDIYNDWEDENGVPHTVFHDGHTDYVISPEVENGPVTYDTEQNWYIFALDNNIPPFKILQTVKYHG